MAAPPPVFLRYRNLAIAFGASLLIIVLGPHPRARAYDSLLARTALSAAAGQPAAALASLDEAIAFDPALSSLHLLAARLAAQAGDEPAARAHLESVSAEARQSANLECLKSAGAADPTASSRVMTCLAGQEPREQDASAIPSLIDLPSLAVALRGQLELESGDLSGWEEYAALIELTEPDDVAAAIREAYRHYPEGSRILDGLWLEAHRDPAPSLAERAARAGQLLAADGRWSLAGAAWSRALELEPVFPQAQAYLGLALSRTGGDGLPLLLQAVANAPDDPVVRALLGQYWLSTGDSAGAIRELDYARRLDPRNPAVSAALGAALGQAGLLMEASEAYHQAAILEPQNPDFWLLLAEFSLRHDYQVDSLGLDAARNAAALAPSDARTISALGLANALAGDPLAGERLLSAAIALEPSNALTWYRYALVLLDQGRVDEARLALATAVQFDPGGIVAQLADSSLSNLAEASP